jgi:hypothetical protein
MCPSISKFYPLKYVYGFKLMATSVEHKSNFNQIESSKPFSTSVVEHHSTGTDKCSLLAPCFEQITDPEAQGFMPKKGHVCLYFFGTHNFANIKEDPVAVKPFYENLHLV